MTPAFRKALELHAPVAHTERDPMNRTPEANAAFRAANLSRASLTDENWPYKIYAFRKLYKLPIPDVIEPLGVSDARLHLMMLQEELDETKVALLGGDVTESVDGLLDLIYVALGTLLQLGLNEAEIRDAMNEIHASNMTKVDDDGQPVYDISGKVQKGGNYVKADLSTILARRADKHSA